PRRGSGAAHRGPTRAGTHAGARGPDSPGRAKGGASVTEDAVYHDTPPGGPLTAGKGGPHRGRVAHATAAPRVDPLSMRARWEFPQSFLCQRAACLSCPLWRLGFFAHGQKTPFLQSTCIQRLYILKNDAQLV